MLYAKALYPLALSIAQTQHLDESYVADIHRQQGDYLYTKGDWDGAMVCYVKTIGRVKPSYVARKVIIRILFAKLGLTIITVPRRSAHTQSRDLPARIACAWTRKC